MAIEPAFSLSDEQAAAAEKKLESSMDRLRAWTHSVAGLKEALAGPQDLDRMAGRIEHVMMPWKGNRIHLEVHAAAGTSGAPAIVFSPGIGAYARFYLPLLGKLCDEGFNVIGIDRPGHGLSEGRRGDCSIGEILDVVERVVGYARERFCGPVALAGSSFGGIISWYALTREPAVDAVLCHNIAHPTIFPDRAARVKAAVSKWLARIAPLAPMPIRQVADFELVSISPEILDACRNEEDSIWCWKLTLRSMVSLFTYKAPRDWSEVTIPTLVLVGEHDEMVPVRFHEEIMRKAKLPNGELRIIPGVAHLLFHDFLDQVLPTVTGWLRDATTARAARTGR